MRQDDTATGAGTNTAGGLVTDAATGLVARCPDVVARSAPSRTRPVHVAGLDPTPSSPLGLTARVYGMGPHPVYSRRASQRRGRPRAAARRPLRRGTGVWCDSSVYRATARQREAPGSPRPASAGKAAERRRNRVPSQRDLANQDPRFRESRFRNLAGPHGQDRWRRSCGSPRAPTEPAGTRGGSHASTRPRTAKPKHARHAA